MQIIVLTVALDPASVAVAGVLCDAVQGREPLDGLAKLVLAGPAAADGPGRAELLRHPAKAVEVAGIDLDLAVLYPAGWLWPGGTNHEDSPCARANRLDHFFDHAGVKVCQRVGHFLRHQLIVNLGFNGDPTAYYTVVGAVIWVARLGFLRNPLLVRLFLA